MIYFQFYKEKIKQNRMEETSKITGHKGRPRGSKTRFGVGMIISLK